MIFQNSCEFFNFFQVFKYFSFILKFYVFVTKFWITLKNFSGNETNSFTVKFLNSLSKKVTSKMEENSGKNSSKFFQIFSTSGNIQKLSPNLTSGWECTREAFLTIISNSYWQICKQKLSNKLLFFYSKKICWFFKIRVNFLIFFKFLNIFLLF